MIGRRMPVKEVSDREDEKKTAGSPAAEIEP
jgi:hypothetical protein